MSEAIQKDEGEDASTPLVREVKDPENSVVLKLIRRTLGSPPKLEGRYRIIAERDTLQWSVIAVRMGVLADAVSTTILQPNFPFIARAGASEDSFDSTSPFGFSAATYFLPMTALLGAAITSAFIGSLSDTVGRRPCLLGCVGLSVIGTIAKYLARGSFWGFCAANFINGLFGGAVPVALAYASDVHPNRKHKDDEIGIIIGVNMIGMSGGGIAAILMEDTGLFSPLWVGAAMNFAATVFMYFFLIEPDSSIQFEEEVDEDDDVAVDELNVTVMSNIVVGALLDNVGSTGLYPLCLAPLAFEAFLTDFLEVGQSPLMTSSAYRWITVLVVLMVIPGAMLSQPVFAKIGAAGGCVAGNTLTAVGIFACMLIVGIDPPTKGTLSGFVVALYLIFPLTVLSQLSTGPMLDRISPVNKRGFAQGLNVTVMNLGNAVAPWVFGMMADSAGTTATLWTTIGVSLLAALVNLPLVFRPELRHKEKPNYQQAMGLEDQELVERAMRGEWVPASFLAELDEARMKQGLPFLMTPVKSYEEDKPHLAEFRKRGMEDFRFWRFKAYEWLSVMDEPGKKEEISKAITKSAPDEDGQEKIAEDFGRWFGQYMKDSGYYLDGGNPTLHKQMIMKAFPPINTDHEVNEHNIEKMVLRYIKIANNFLDEGGRSGATTAFRNSVVM